MNANDPAIPTTGCVSTGLTIREHMATQAMQGLLASLSDEEVQLGISVKQIALASVAYADSLISELNKPTTANPAT